MVKRLRLRPLTPATGVRIPLESPRRNGLCCVPIFLCRKIGHTRRRSSSFVKRHIRVGYSLASALITPLAHYHLFTSGSAAPGILVERSAIFWIQYNPLACKGVVIFRIIVCSFEDKCFCSENFALFLEQPHTICRLEVVALVFCVYFVWCLLYFYPGELLYASANSKYLSILFC